MLIFKMLPDAGDDPRVVRAEKNVEGKKCPEAMFIVFLRISGGIDPRQFCRRGLLVLQFWTLSAIDINCRAVIR
jgi:hypothetical protein